MAPKSPYNDDNNDDDDDSNNDDDYDDDMMTTTTLNMAVVYQGIYNKYWHYGLLLYIISHVNVVMSTNTCIRPTQLTAFLLEWDILSFICGGLWNVARYYTLLFLISFFLEA